MGLIDSIFSLVWDIADWFWQLYYESQDIPIVGTVISNIFFNLYRVFWSLLTPIAHFGDWVNDVSTKVSNILSQEGVLGLLRYWFPWLEPVGVWFSDRWNWFLQNVNIWWDTKRPIVQGWIDTATQGLSSLTVAWGNFWGVTWPSWVSSFNSLKSTWDNFWTVTFPTLVSFAWLGIWWEGKQKEIDTLINSKLKVWFPFYDDLVRLWGDIKLFFTDPLEYLWERFSYWFFGKE